MVDEIETYLENLLEETDESAFCTASGESSLEILSLMEWTKQVLRICKEKEKILSIDNLKKLRFTIVDRPCFNDIIGLQGKNNRVKYEYYIFLPFIPITSRYEKESPYKEEDVFKHIIAHELAHFLFKLQPPQTPFQSKSEEDVACNKRAKEWGFSVPQEKKK